MACPDRRHVPARRPCDCASAQAAKKDVALPEAARKTIEAEFSGAKILSVERERERGVVYFEVELKTYQGGTIEVEVTADGKLGEIETEIALADLPEEVAAKVRQVTARATVKEIERIDIRGVPLFGTFAALAEPLTYYDVKYAFPGRKHTLQVQLGMTGNVLVKPKPDDGDDEEEEDNEEEEDD